MPPPKLDPEDEEIQAARRNLSLRGMGLVFLANGIILALFWTTCYKALGGSLSAQPEIVHRLAWSGYSILAFACLAYIIVMDMETAFQDGGEAARRITLDWIWWCLVPLSVYIAFSALGMAIPLPEPRQMAVLEGILSGLLVLYGFLVTRYRFSAHRNR